MVVDHMTHDTITAFANIATTGLHETLLIRIITPDGRGRDVQAAQGHTTGRRNRANRQGG